MQVLTKDEAKMNEDIQIMELEGAAAKVKAELDLLNFQTDHTGAALVQAQEKHDASIQATADASMKLNQINEQAQHLRDGTSPEDKKGVPYQSLDWLITSKPGTLIPYQGPADYIWEIKWGDKQSG
jgi:hypothetical protein